MLRKLRISCTHSWKGGVVPSNTVGCGKRPWGSMTGSGGGGAAAAAPAPAAAPATGGAGGGGPFAFAAGPNIMM